MRSVAVMSWMERMPGLLVLSRLTPWVNAEMPRTSMDRPLVRSQMISRPGTPPATTSTAPDSSASFITSDERKVDQLTSTAPSPASAACFSISLPSSSSAICK